MLSSLTDDARCPPPCVLQYDRTRTWASYDDVLPEFKTTVQDELHQLYQQLEDDFGTEIVSFFFGLIMCSRDGVLAVVVVVGMIGLGIARLYVLPSSSLFVPPCSES